LKTGQNIKITGEQEEFTRILATTTAPNPNLVHIVDVPGRDGPAAIVEFCLQQVEMSFDGCGIESGGPLGIESRVSTWRTVWMTAQEMVKPMVSRDTSTQLFSSLVLRLVFPVGWRQIHRV
jgi:hypothetical protein